MSEPGHRDGGELSPLKRALLAIERLQDKVRRLEGERRRPLAVVGMACRFPLGSGPEEYYEALRAGRGAIRPLPPAVRPGWPAPDDGASIPFPPAGYLEVDVSAFDPGFFGISPREAESIDPQQRLLLEVAWEALEHAGIDPYGLEGTRSGVFVGLAGNDYAQMQIASERATELLNPHYASGIGHSMASGRIAYLLGLHGPAITVDTACSSSLVAIHLACQSLRAGESDLALAAGTNLILTHDSTLAFQQSRMLSPDGRCKAFDAAADGFSRGEGCGVVALKRLDDALRDGDRVLAVVRGSAVNQDGPSSGLTAPHGPAQEAVMRAALEQAGLTSDDIDYVEAHGTGTELGDPIEMQALGSVFAGRPSERPLLVGSVKTNMGHLEAAAGIAGFIKVVQALRHGEVPPHLHFSEPSPHIPWKRLAVTIPTELTPLSDAAGLRRAGVSSFGFSGTNAHVILEEAPGPDEPESGSDEDAPVREEATPERPLHLLALSAPDDAGLEELGRRYVDRLAACEDGFADVCHTANAGRAHFSRRLALRAADADTARRSLESWLGGREAPAVCTGRPDLSDDRTALAFLYTGQGAQYPSMGWELQRTSPVFARALRECDEILRDHIEVALLELLDPGGDHTELVHRTDFTQPALFALQYALTELWASWGIRPDVVMGHSIGELPAAYVAGVFSLEDALRVVAARGRHMHAVERGGRMLAVMAPEERVTRWVDEAGGDLAVAAVNSPAQIVVSGAVEAVDEIETRAEAEGVAVRALRTSHAFHSPLMDGAVSAFTEELRDVRLQPASRVRFVSTVTGGTVKPAELAERDYWARQLRATVRFDDAVRAAAALAKRAVEIGPHPSLAGLVGQGDTDLAVYPSLHRDRDAWDTVLGSLGELYVEGVDPDWRGFEEGRGRLRVELPTYPFRRTSLWVDLGSGRREDMAGAHPLLGAARPRPGPAREFERTLRDDAPAFIGEHRVLGRALLPGTAFVEMCLAAAGEVFGGEVRVEDLDLLAPMSFEEGPRRVHVALERDGPAGGRVRIHSASTGMDAEGVWTLHATATARVAGEARPGPVDLTAVRERCPDVLEADTFYTGLGELGYQFGPRLRGVRDIMMGPEESLARVSLPEACEEDPGGYRVHPLLVDSALQAVGPALGGDDGGRTYLPVAVERVFATAALPTEVWAHVRITGRGEGNCTADVALVGEEGDVLACLEGVVFREVTAGELVRRGDDPFLQMRWLPDPTDARPAPTADSGARRSVMERVRRALADGAVEYGAAEYDSFVDELESRAGAYVAHAFVGLGWDPREGARVSLDEVAEELRVVENRRRLLARGLDILTEEGFLTPSSEGWTVARPLTDGMPPQGDGAATETPPERVMLDRCGPHFADNLRGAGDPLELLFPGGDASDAERMYHDTPPARIFNRAVAEAISAIGEATPHGRSLRVLEVGAGTGGTTRHVMERLSATPSGSTATVEYTFTDVSPLFVERARQRFSGVPGMEYAVLDLDRPPEEQGFEPGSYDVVVAANCLHAAKDLRGAVEGVRRLLRPGGLLLAVEVFEPHRWFDLTVGLTDGWWHFTDVELRERYACVPPDAWRSVLEEAGFDDARPLPLAEIAGGGLDGPASRGQGLVLATRGEPIGADAAADRWLLVLDEAGLGEEVAAILRSGGADVAAIRPTGATPSEIESELREALTNRSRWSGVVHCAALDHERGLDAAGLDARVQRGTGTLLAAARVAGDDTGVDRLFVVTRGAQVVDDHDADVDVAGAACWGLARTVRLEVPGLACRCLDLEPTPWPDEAGLVAAWMTRSEGEPERAVRRGRSLVPRLVPAGDVPDDALPALPSEYRLARPASGALEELTFHSGFREAPAPGEVEIRVAASGLNFKDVLNVLGMYPGDPGPLGSESSGVVTAVGEGVDLALGTPVVAVAGHGYDKHVRADATLVAPLPPGLSFAQGATLPVAYLTAHFALSHLGRIARGDRVLVHAAAGGVGTAACALARRAGAEVFATAGSEAKRAALRARGIRHVFDSRSDAFVEGVMEATEGAGVDVILNSLADELVDRSFDVLAPGGRFLEIGKRGIWTHEQVEALDRDIEYHVIDWGMTHEQDPELVGRLFREVMDAVGSGELDPLPVDLFPVERVVDAFRHMAHARHVGKVVLTHPVLAGEGPIAFDPSGTYLVTGGTSGLGLQTAVWAAGEGARTLVVASRGEPGPDGAAVLETLRRSGVTVHARQCDVGDPDAVSALVDWMAETLPPLRGVVHSAGALSDRTLRHATWKDFEVVLRAKARGPALLAEATRGAELDFFVAYSSIASVLGSPGQGNHAAANAFLDAFAATRWRAGATGVSIAWGPWSETGAAAEEDTLARTRGLGIGALTTREGLDRLARALGRPRPLLIATRIEDPAILRARGGSRLFDELKSGDRVAAATSDEGQTGPDGAASALSQVLAATPAGGRRAVLMRRIRERVRTVLGLGSEVALDADRPLGELGLDSLLAVELRNALGGDVERRLPATLLFDHPTVAALTDHLLELLASDGALGTEPAAVKGAEGDRLGEVEALSDDDVDRLLAERLKSRG